MTEGRSSVRTEE